MAETLTSSPRDHRSAESARAATAGLVARLLLCSAFLASGATKLLDFPGAVAEVRALTGVEPASLVAAGVILVQLGGSGLVLAGGRPARLGAALLAAFTLLATPLAHNFWTKTGPERMRDTAVFFEHMGLIGGFILVALLARTRRGVRT
jgi:uncharacterized membrane protein YphA (DoxX/SURF4 family)